MPTYLDPIRGAFIDLWAHMIAVLPQFIFALIVMLLGVLVANVLREAVVRVVKLLRVDEAMHKLEVSDLVNQTGFELKVGELLGWIVKWFVIILTLIIAADTLGWKEVTSFLSTVVTYLPNVFIAVIILLVGTLLGRFVQDIIVQGLQAAKMRTAGFIGGVAKWAIYVFSLMAALVQLGIAQSLIQILFIGFVAMVALAGGLAFGLGGKEHAAKVLDHVADDFKNSMRS